MACCVSRQAEPNPALWLATQEDNMYELLTKCEVRILAKFFFCKFMDRDWVEVLKQG